MPMDARTRVTLGLLKETNSSSHHKLLQSPKRLFVTVLPRRRLALTAETAVRGPAPGIKESRTAPP